MNRHQHGDLTIVTTNTYPPVPWRTEAGAIEDLKQRLEEDC